jgi:dephospho-CoA kinase
MFIIGITGGTGSGKTTALCAVESWRLIIDCDAIYHELLQNNTPDAQGINTRFDGAVVNSVLDRKKLGKLVFNNAKP